MRDSVRVNKPGRLIPPSTESKERKAEQKDFYFMIHYNSAFAFRFGGRQLHASEDNGSVNHASIRDWDEEAERLEKFGAELEAD